MSITNLEKRAILQILLHLYQNEKASRTELRTNITAQLDTIYSSLEVLEELGLIKESTEKTFPFKVEAYLTEKGKIIASYVQKIHDELKSRS